MTGSPVADLHVHTTASDGVLSVEEIPAAARDASLHTVALTDHDRFNPSLKDPVTTVDGIRVIRGIELKVSCPNGTTIDLLGYATTETPALASLIADLQTNRIERAREMIAQLERALDISIDCPMHEGIGRPHIAQAVADHSAVSLTKDDVFDEYIGDGRPCHVQREIPTLAEGARILTDACQLVSVAHPLRYDDLEAALAAAVDVGAIERWYPYDRPVDPSPIDRAIADHSLIPTGGSDAHGPQLGQCGLDEPACQRFLTALGSA